MIEYTLLEILLATVIGTAIGIGIIYFVHWWEYGDEQKS
jgi:hypothetical protein